MLANDRHVEHMDFLVASLAEGANIVYVEAVVAQDKLVIPLTLAGPLFKVPDDHLLTALMMTLELVLALALLTLVVDVPEIELHRKSSDRPVRACKTRLPLAIA